MYSLIGKKDAEGRLIPGTSLKAMLDDEEDFKEEVSMVEYIAGLCGIQVFATTKGHPEIAGDGIENCWAVGKQTYRAMPRNTRDTKEKFMAAMDKAFSASTLSRLTVNGCSRKARNYMTAYLALHLSEKQEKGEGNDLSKNTLKAMLTNPDNVAMEKIEFFRAYTSKTHRSCLDFSGKEIKLISQEAKMLMKSIGRRDSH